MYDVIFTFRSMTAAQRGQYACARHNIHSNLIRVPYNLADKGCGYAIQISADMLDQVVLIFKVDHITYERIYRQYGNQIQEVLL